MLRYKSFILVLIISNIVLSTQLSAVELKTPPNSTDNQPLVVQIGLTILQIISIDQPNQILTGRFDMTSSWIDDREAYESEDGSPRVYTGDDVTEVLKAMWTPDLEVSNQSGIEQIETNKLEIYPNGSVVHSERLILDISTNFDYTRFPFDEQDLVIEIQSLTYPAGVLVFNVLEGLTGIDKGFRSDEWLAYPMRVFAGYKIKKGYDGEGYYSQNSSYVNFQMKLERRSVFYLLRVLLPYGFFILLSTCVFWMHRESIERRVSVVVTFALTSVAFNLLVIQYTPSVPYRVMINSMISAGYFWAGGIIISIIGLQFFKYAGYNRVWDWGNIFFRFFTPLMMLVTWFIIYNNFMKRELQVIYLIH